MGMDLMELARKAGTSPSRSTYTLKMVLLAWKNGGSLSIVTDLPTAHEGGLELRWRTMAGMVNTFPV